MADLPASSRLKTALKRRGVGFLGDLDGWREQELRDACSESRVFEELQKLLAWAVAGAVRLAEAGAPDTAGLNIIDVIDSLVRSLPERELAILRLRYGGAEEETLTDLGPKSGFCAAVASGMILRAVVRVRRQGGNDLEARLRKVAEACLKAARPLTPEVIRSWMRRPPASFRCGPAFYMRLIAELSHGEVPVWPVKRRSSLA